MPRPLLGELLPLLAAKGVFSVEDYSNGGASYIPIIDEALRQEKHRRIFLIRLGSCLLVAAAFVGALSFWDESNTTTSTSDASMYIP